VLLSDSIVSWCCELALTALRYVSGWTLINEEGTSGKLKLTPKQADDADNNKTKVMRYDSEIDNLSGYKDAPGCI